MNVDLEGLAVARHPLPEWATFVELREGTGYGLDGQCDVAAFNCWPSKGQRVAYEVKRSKGDFRRELDNPIKRDWLEKYFHQTYFVTIPGVCTEDEVPDGWGLLVSTKKGDKLRRLKVARAREPEEVPEWLWLSALRSAVRAEAEERNRLHRFDGVAITPEDLSAKVKEQVTASLKYERELARRTQDQLDNKIKELQEEKDRLREPLRLVAERVSGKSTYGMFYNGPTVEEVTKWLDDAAAGNNVKILKKVTQAHRLLSDLLKAGEIHE